MIVGALLQVEDHLLFHIEAQAIAGADCVIRVRLQITFPIMTGAFTLNMVILNLHTH